MNLNRIGGNMEHVVAAQESELFEGEWTAEAQRINHEDCGSRCRRSVAGKLE